MATRAVHQAEGTTREEGRPGRARALPSSEVVSERGKNRRKCDPKNAKHCACVKIPYCRCKNKGGQGGGGGVGGLVGLDAAGSGRFQAGQRRTCLASLSSSSRRVVTNVFAVSPCGMCEC